MTGRTGRHLHHDPGGSLRLAFDDCPCRSATPVRFSFELTPLPGACPRHGTHRPGGRCGACSPALWPRGRRRG